MINPINQILEEVSFDTIVYTLDWHPSNHLSFIDNVHNRKMHASTKVNNWDLIVQAANAARNLEISLW